MYGESFWESGQAVESPASLKVFQNCLDMVLVPRGPGGWTRWCPEGPFQPQPFCAFVRSHKIHVCLMTVKTKDFTLKTEVVELTVAAVLLVGGWETFQRVSAKDTFLMVLWCLWIIISSLKSFFVRVVVLQSKWSWSTQRSWQMGVLKLELWKLGQNMQFHVKFWKQKDHFSVLG